MKNAGNLNINESSEYLKEESYELLQDMILAEINQSSDFDFESKIIIADD